MNTEKYAKYQLQGSGTASDGSPSWLRRHRRVLLASVILFSLSALLIFLVRTVHGLGPFYSHYVYPILPNTLGRLLSPLPFSLFELLLCLVLLGAVLPVLFSVFSIFTGRGRKRLALGISRSFPAVLCIVSALFFTQTLTCLLNYSRVDFPEEIGISTYAATPEDLTQLCQLLIGDLNDVLSLPDMHGGMDLAAINVGDAARDSMKKLGQTYPTLSGYYPNPKPIFFSKVMSTVNLTGIFSPYTTEANYNRDVTPYVMPYTICHELAHAKGYIKENEAGFIAYLACQGSDNPQFRYSGALSALSYSMNALYRSVSYEDYQQVLRTVPAQALSDLQTNQAYWQEYSQGVKGAIAEAASAANDHYLKANAQADGAKSYGRMVDLLLAYYRIGAAEL